MSGALLLAEGQVRMNREPSWWINQEWVWVCFALGLAGILLGACASASRLATAPPVETLLFGPTGTATPALAPVKPAPAIHTSTNTPAPSRPSAQPSPTPMLSVCSPLKGIPLQSLSVHIVNPFHPPLQAGSDDPHQGVDLAVLSPGGSMALAGNPVSAVLAGRVAAVISDRFPYGNAVMVETALNDLPGSWLDQLALPGPTPTLAVIPALTCPTAEALETGASGSSLYLLYAHMQPASIGQAAPGLRPGDPVTCGQDLGTVGNSGNALNPHLHLEARVGPSGARFASIAHYDSSATPQEMSNYCTWRVSGLFQLLDPLQILQLNR